MSENIRGGLDREVLAGLHRVIPAFGDVQGGNPIDAYLTSGEINKMLAQILSCLKSQMPENPYEENTEEWIGFRLAIKTVQSKLL